MKGSATSAVVAAAYVIISLVLGYISVVAGLKVCIGMLLMRFSGPISLT
jgi:hypothetical protein